MKKDIENTEDLYNYDEEIYSKKLNKKKIITASVICIFVMIIIVLIAMYISDANFRRQVDKYILIKDVQENNLPYISLNENESYQVYALGRYITLLNKNELSFFNSAGKKEATQTAEITTPLVATNGNYMAIANKDGQKIYVFSETNKVWESQLEGNISRITINQNGYCAVVITGTAYKSVIQIFNPNGKELFKTYLSNSIAMDIEISKDNQYLSFAEVNTSGTLLQTYIKTISISKAQESPRDSIVYTYTAPSNCLSVKIKYQDGNKLICMYDNEIHVMYEGKDETLLSIKEAENKFADINLNNHIVTITEKNVLLSTQSTAEIMNIANKSKSSYTVSGAVKEIYTYEDTIAINLGSEVHFIGNNGWLKKKYTSTQEIKNIVLSSNFAGIVYRNKIELVSL